MFSAAICLVLPRTVNDSAMYVSGAPSSLMGKTTVRMVREQISIHIGKSCLYECEFEFKNDGPTQNVKIGFPDESHGMIGPAEDPKPRPQIRNFKSWVDGAEVDVKIEKEIKGEIGHAKCWHTKWVKFEAGQTRKIRNTYLSDLGWFPPSQFAIYTVSTGASWKGVIEESKIIVVFKQPRFRNLIVGPGSGADTVKADKDFWRKKPLNYVVCEGFSKPVVEANKMTLVKKNFKPTRDDNLVIFWRFPIIDNEPEET